MRTLPTPIPGLVLVDPDVFGDHRGWFVETFQRDRYANAGIGVGLEFVQDNLSSSVLGTVRGLHYQLNNPQGKLVHVTRGEVFDVAVDIRFGSPTFGKSHCVELSAENHLQLWIPPGFAHGFMVTSTQAEVAYKVTAVYNGEDEHSIAWDDQDLAIPWPPMARVKISTRDAILPKHLP